MGKANRPIHILACAILYVAFSVSGPVAQSIWSRDSGKAFKNDEAGYSLLYRENWSISGHGGLVEFRAPGDGAIVTVRVDQMDAVSLASSYDAAESVIAGLRDEVEVDRDKVPPFEMTPPPEPFLAWYGIGYRNASYSGQVYTAVKKDKLICIHIRIATGNRSGKGLEDDVDAAFLIQSSFRLLSTGYVRVKDNPLGVSFLYRDNVEPDLSKDGVFYAPNARGQIPDGMSIIQISTMKIEAGLDEFEFLDKVRDEVLKMNIRVKIPPSAIFLAGFSWARASFSGPANQTELYIHIFNGNAVCISFTIPSAVSDADRVEDEASCQVFLDSLSIDMQKFVGFIKPID